jgi:hypothetical protein
VVCDGFRAHPLSGIRARAGEDLIALGERLASAALDLA